MCLGAAHGDGMEGDTHSAMTVTQDGTDMVGKRILVVEDNITNQILITAILEQLGCDI